MKRIFLFLGILILSSPWAWAQLKEVKPPVEYPMNRLWIYLLFGILTALLSLFLFNLYRTVSRKSVSSEIKSPQETAYARLEELHRRFLPEKGELKEYYTVLGDILRRYCEDRFRVRAAEMTTPEFLEHVRKTQLFSAEREALFREFLDSCDMVKFAKYTPGRVEAEHSFELAKKIIDQTKD